MDSVTVSSFYRFSDVDQSALESIKKNLEEAAKREQVRGLLILACEGLNGTFAGTQAAVDAFQAYLPTLLGAGGWDFKNSFCKTAPFRSFRVKLRPEIVTTRSTKAVHVDGNTRKLSPLEWHEALTNFDPNEAVLLDTRNAYETEIGKFRGALDPQLKNFQEFEDFVEKSAIPKDKKVFMYCTGGIRCEKASIQMERLGYEQVYQLEGGILRYMEQFPGQEFEGECFVFDNRVSLDQQLQPSQTWKFCPHCGDPAKTEILCSHCGCSAKVCDSCLVETSKHTCSKDCSHRFALRRKKEAAASDTHISE